MKRHFIIITLLATIFSGLKAQVKIGGTGNPDVHAVLELDAGINKGLLLPRLTNDRMVAMSAAPNGLVVFNTTDGFIYCRTGGAWKKLPQGNTNFSLPFADTVSMNGGFLFDIAKDGTGGAAIIGKGINNATGVIGYSLNGTGVVGNSENGIGGYFTSFTGTAIYAGGNIGVNEATPHSPLTFTNSNGNKIAFGGTGNAHFGMGMQNQLLQFSVPDNASGFGFGFGSSNNFTERLRITGEGHVGINHVAPYAPLTVGGNWGNRIAFLGDANIQYGMGVQENLMQLYTPTQWADIGFGFGSSYNFTEVMRIKGNGKVGIGTPNPTARLHIEGGDAFINTTTGYFRLGNPNSNQWRMATLNSGADLVWGSSTDAGATFTHHHYFSKEGNMGIGTGAVSPLAKLEVKGAGSTSSTHTLVLRNALGDTLLRMEDNGRMGIGYNGTYGRTLSLGGNGINLFSPNKVLGGAIIPTDTSLVIWSGTGDNQYLLLQPSWGNTGIGTYSPNAKLHLNGAMLIGDNAQRPAIGYALSVDGAVVAEGFTTLNSTSWPDYVFDKDYSLMPLARLKEYVNSNKHLPGIPDAPTIEKKGINLGEMTKKLTEKIEELTLYVIDLDRKYSTLVKELEVIRNNQK